MVHRYLSAPAFFLIVALAIPASASPSPAQIPCREVVYGAPDHHEKMDDLARRARLPESYWTRYHEAAVDYLCKGQTAEVDNLVNFGYLDGREAQRIAKVLGKAFTPKPQTSEGKRYAYLVKRFRDMDACSACADNIAQYVMKKPDSPCAKLANKALANDQAARKEIAESPDYCIWKE